MDSTFLSSLLVSLPVVIGYFVVRLAVRHGVMDAHRRMQVGEVSRSQRSA